MIKQSCQFSHKEIFTIISQVNYHDFIQISKEAYINHVELLVCSLSYDRNRKYVIKLNSTKQNPFWWYSSDE